MGYNCINVGVESSSRFHFKVRTHRVVDTTDQWSPYPTSWLPPPAWDTKMECGRVQTNAIPQWNWQVPLQVRYSRMNVIKVGLY